MPKEEVYIYWIDKYSKGYAKGAMHGSIDGLATLCGRKFELMEWDGGYNTTKSYSIDCKKCLKKLK